MLIPSYRKQLKHIIWSLIHHWENQYVCGRRAALNSLCMLQLVILKKMWVWKSLVSGETLKTCHDVLQQREPIKQKSVSYILYFIWFDWLNWFQFLPTFSKNYQDSFKWAHFKLLFTPFLCLHTAKTCSKSPIAGGLTTTSLKSLCSLATLNIQKIFH